MASPSRTVQRIHFEDFGGVEFERLVFAYHVRAGWNNLAWYGQTGSDQGRDIVGMDMFDASSPRRTVIQCVNRGALTRTKAEADMQAAVSAPTGRIDAIKFVARGSISAKARDAVEASARALSIEHLTIWSAVEFEENLRLRAEDLLRRFCAGEVFPDSGDDIRRFADDFAGLNDDEALRLMAPLFDRPAFRTPFHQESSLPAFLQAIEDTIGALNTGIWRTRDGDEIRRIPSLHHLRDPLTQGHVREAARQVDELRRVFIGGLRDGSIKPCSCGKSYCHTFMLNHGIDRKLDQLRMRVTRCVPIGPSAI
ncbi:restriction endonuclease [Bradyrhizobium sp. WSM3983]|uniref:restriction endonuclease n=1 Tax=Bradyrhizobium sp. WSM3983 TaxID=1038867 RepID=UPI0018DBF7BE|nr:hypothetical protein [Bradyrhizobium sp. WSM3983]